MFNRITGVFLSGGLYVYLIGYLVGPTVGLHLEPTVLAASFAAWPVAAKVAAKAIVAAPFVFHTFNGVRHLVWDFGLALSKTTVARTGWTVVGITALGTLYLSLGY
jgi:succinate dehydrogenase (ubiquinone) cytochrome b560 subunit